MRWFGPSRRPSVKNVMRCLRPEDADLESLFRRLLSGVVDEQAALRRVLLLLSLLSALVGRKVAIAARPPCRNHASRIERMPRDSTKSEFSGGRHPRHLHGAGVDARSCF